MVIIQGTDKWEADFTMIKPLNCNTDDRLMFYSAHQSATPWNHCSSNSCN